MKKSIIVACIAGAAVALLLAGCPTPAGGSGVPAAPTGVTATAGDGQVSVSWTAVSGATSYNVYWLAGATVTSANGTKVTGATSPAVVDGLTDGAQYAFIVTAVNAAGESAASTVATATPTAAGTVVQVTENIDADATWSAGHVYVVSGIYVNKKLTINPGAVVKVQNDGWIHVNAGGSISAVGTSSTTTSTTAPIIFTSYKDDTVGGNTDGATATAAPSDWRGIYVDSANCVFTYCTFSYCGSSSEAALTLASGSNTTSVTNCTFSSNVDGLDASAAGSSTTISNDTFFSNTGVPLYINSGVSATSNTFHSGTAKNSYQGIVISGDINADCTLSCTEVAYVVGGMAVNKKLTINPGVVVKATSDGWLHVNSTGSISAVGTSAAVPIIFTSYKDDTVGGDSDNSAATASATNWRGIYVDSANSVFTYCTFSYCGSSSEAALTLTSGSNTTSVTNCTFSSNVDGLDASAAGGSTTISNDTFFSNTGVPLYINSGVSATSNTFHSGTAKNSYQGIVISGDIDADCTLSCTEVAYVVGGVAVNKKLTINPGVVVKAQSDGWLHVNAGGSISALGTSAAVPIIFTSYPDDTVGGDSDGSASSPARANWRGLYIAAPNCAFTYCTFAYCGSSGEAAVTLASGSTATSVMNCTFQHNDIGLDSTDVGTGSTIMANDYVDNTTNTVP